MRKQIRKKLSLNKETLRSLSARNLRAAAGGITALCSNTCEPTLQSDCYCFTDDCGTHDSCSTAGPWC